MAETIFRKKSLERFSSPEQLDRLMQVTRPLQWLSLLGCFILIGVGLIWGYRGEIFSKVHGQGILLTSGSIYDVVSLGTGRLDTVLVHVNDAIQKGQVLALLSQPDLEQQIHEVKEDLKNLEAERTLIQSLDQKTLDLKKKYLSEKRQAMNEAIGFNEQRLTFLAAQVETKRRLLEENLLTRIQYEDAVKEHKSTLQELMRLRSEISNLSAQEVDLDSRREKDLITVEYRISQAKEKIKAHREKLKLQSEVVSPNAGTVLEIFKDAGKVIGMGEPLLSLEIGHEKEEFHSVIIYFPPLEGKKIRVGMTAQVAPSVVKMESYGYVLAEVCEVSNFPASRKGVLRVLQNEDLVKSLTVGGAPIMVKAKLLSDSGTYSGYKWSSGQGPPLKIQSGTLCTAGVVVERHRPVDLLFPYLKRQFLGIGEDHVRIHP